jgi:hypothetical protein
MQRKENPMANVGGIDRILRFIVGTLLVLAAFVPALAVFGAWIWVLPAVGLVMIATALFRFCPAYLPFGWNTCGRG